jgi:hypothetical protein
MIPVNQKRPVRFTGRHGDTYYYRGRKWLGPTNCVGIGACNARGQKGDGTHVEVFGDNGLIAGVRERG